MYEREKNLKSLFTRIAVVLLFLILFFNIYSIAYVGCDLLITAFPSVIWIECAADLFCSFLYLLSFLAPVWIFYGLSQGKEAQAVDFSVTLPCSHTFFKTISILFVSLGTIIAASYLNSWLIPSFSSTGSVEIDHPYQLVLLMFSSAVIPAFAEELLFRGVILANLKPFGKGMAVLVSALLFGLMHMNLSQFFYATVAGVVLGLVYMATNSLWLCILIHFANNMFSVLENYVFQIVPSQRAGLICMLAELVIFAVGLLSALIYWLTKKQGRHTERKTTIFGLDTGVRNLVEGHRVAKLFFCPAMIVYVISAVVNMVYVLLAQYGAS